MKQYYVLGGVFAAALLFMYWQSAPGTGNATGELASVLGTASQRADAAERSETTGAGGSMAQSSGQQQSGQQSAQSASKVPADISTATFVQKAAISDMFELESSRVAKAKQVGQDITTFANEMIDDHSRTSDMLKTFVSTGKVKAQIPNALDQDHQQKLDKLRAQNGQQFEQTFKQMQVEAHQAAIDLFSTYGQNGDNVDLKQWAATTVPTLKQHLAMAQKLGGQAETTSQAPTQSPSQSQSPAQAPRQ